MEIPTKEETDFKIQVCKNVFDKFSKHIKIKLSFGPPMVLMCMIMSEVPDLKICNDDELLVIQNEMVRYVKDTVSHVT